MESEETMDDSKTVSSSVTPLKKKRVLKHVKKKIKSGLNSSVHKRKSTAFNFSLSSSIHKQTTLRANNRALAYNLERTREDLRAANDIVIELRRENQELTLQNTNLQQVVGLKNEDIETEVRRRMEIYTEEVKCLLGKMGQSLYDTSSFLGEAMDKCVQLSRQSLGGVSRGSSIGNITVNSTMSENGDNEQSARRSLYYQPPKRSSLDALKLDGATTNLHEMSIICEQSLLLDNVTPPDELMTDQMADVIESVSESNIKDQSNGIDKTQMNKEPISNDTIQNQQPKRVLKQKSSCKSKEIEVTASKFKEPNLNYKLALQGSAMENMQNRITTENSIITKLRSDKKKDLQDEAVEDIQDKIPTANSIITKLMSGSKNKVDDDGHKDGETFVAPKTPELRKKKNGAMEEMNSTKGSEKDKKDRRETFVVTGNCLNNIKDKLDMIKDRRGTFVVTKSNTDKPDDSNSDQITASKKDRRGTFVISGSKSEILNDKLAEKMDEENIPEDVTTIFNDNNMELTEVANVDINMLLAEPLEDVDNDKQSGSSQSSCPVKTQSSRSKSRSGKNKDESTKSAKKENMNSKTSDGEKMESNNPVEFRLPKPGKIVFSASRKEVDGTRKPVPSKIPTKPRSRSKVKVGKINDPTPDVTPAKIKSIFDFHDKTPTITIESQANSVYDISLNESVVSKKPTLMEFRDKTAVNKENSEVRQKSEVTSKVQLEKHKNLETGKSDNESKKSGKDGNVLPEGPVYYLPLKGCSDDESPKKSEKEKIQDRSRSRSRKRQDSSDSKLNKRTRSQTRQMSEEEDDDCVPRSRGRSKSKRTDSRNRQISDDNDEDYVPRSRGRSVTRKKSNDPGKESDEDDEIVLNTRSRSKSRGRNMVADENNRMSRSRTRSRTRKDKNTDEKEDKIYRRTRSQSRRRQVSVDMATEEKNSTDTESECHIIEKETPVKCESQTKKSESKEVKETERKSRSRSRSCAGVERRKDSVSEIGNQNKDILDSAKVEEPAGQKIGKAKTNRSRSRTRTSEFNNDDSNDNKEKAHRRSSATNKEQFANNDEHEGKISEESEGELLRVKRSKSKREQIQNDCNKKEGTRKSRRSQKSSVFEKGTQENLEDEKEPHVENDEGEYDNKLSVDETPVKKSEKSVKNVEKSAGKSTRKRKKTVSDNDEQQSTSDLLHDNVAENKTTSVSSGSDPDETKSSSTKCFYVTKRGRSLKINQFKDNSFTELDFELNPFVDLKSDCVTGKTRSSLSTDTELPANNVGKTLADTDQNKSELDSNNIEQIPPTPQTKHRKLLSEATRKSGETISENNGDVDIERPKSVKKSDKKPHDSRNIQEENGNDDKKSEKENGSVPNKYEDLKRRLASLGRGRLDSLQRKSSDDRLSEDKVLCERNSLNAVNSEDGEPLMKRSRRAASQVNYKEPSVGGKLRRGDAFTDNFFVSNDIYKSPRNKSRKSVPKKHNLLHDSIVESSTE